MKMEGDVIMKMEAVRSRLRLSSIEVAIVTDIVYMYGPLSRARTQGFQKGVLKL